MKQGTLAGLVLIVITIMIGAILLTGVADEAARQTRDFDSIEDEILPTVDETGEDLSVKGTLPRLRCNMVECRDEFFFDPINPIFYWEDDCTVYAENEVTKTVRTCWAEVTDSEPPFEDFAQEWYEECGMRYECSYGYYCEDGDGPICLNVTTGHEFAHDNDWDTSFQIMKEDVFALVYYQGMYVLPVEVDSGVRATVKWQSDTGTFTTTRTIPQECYQLLPPNGCQDGMYIHMYAQAYGIEGEVQDWGIGCADMGTGLPNWFIVYEGDEVTDNAYIYEMRLEMDNVEYTLLNPYYGADFECDYNYDYDNERPSNWIVNLIPLFFVLAILAAVLIWLRQQEIFDITDSWRK